MPGPGCVIRTLVKGKGRAFWIVVCACGWSRRVYGPEGEARRKHWLHQNDLPDGSFSMRRALIEIGKLDPRYETISDEEGSPTE